MHSGSAKQKPFPLIVELNKFYSIQSSRVGVKDTLSTDTRLFSGYCRLSESCKFMESSLALFTVIYGC